MTTPLPDQYISRDSLHVFGLPGHLLSTSGLQVHSPFPTALPDYLIKMFDENPGLQVDGRLFSSFLSPGKPDSIIIESISGRMKNYDLAGEFNSIFHDQPVFYIKGLTVYVSVGE